MLAVTTIVYVLVCQRRGRLISCHVTACNFSLDRLLFFEVGSDVIVRVALYRSLVPTHGLSTRLFSLIRFQLFVCLEIRRERRSL